MNFEKAREEAAVYLSRRFRTEEEVSQHLRGKGYAEEEIARAVDDLKDYGYINDFDYCQAYYRYGIARDRGRRRIERELLDKGIPRQVIDSAWSALEENAEEDIVTDEMTMAWNAAMKLAKQQKGAGKPLDQKFMARVGRRLSGLGYPSEIIYSVLGKLKEGEDDEEGISI